MSFLKKILKTCTALVITTAVTVPTASPITINFKDKPQLPAAAEKLFSDKPNAQLYWQALLQAAKKDKAAALKTVALIQSPGAASNNSPTEEPATIEDVFDKLFLSEVSRNPQLLSITGLFESIGICEHNAYLNDVSPQAIMQTFKEKKENLKLLKKYSLDTLSPSQKISYKIFLWKLNLAVKGKKFLFHDYRMNHMFGLLFDIKMVFTQYHPLKTAEQVDLYVTRLNNLPEQLLQCIELLEYQKKMGIILPALSLAKDIALIQAVMTPSITDNPFYSHLATSIEKIEIPYKEDVLAKAAHTIKTLVYPAYQTLLDYLTTMLSATSTNRGVWALPDGDQYYAYVLKFHTSTDLSADQIHELGLQEVHKVQEEMRHILALEGISNEEKNVGELVQELLKDPRFFYPKTEEGSKQCLADFGAIIERSRKELYPLFDLKPKVPVKVEGGGVCASYFAPSLDGSRPGIFFVNPEFAYEYAKFTMETLAIHEAEPGHHFQLALQQESNLPILQKLVEDTTYIDGWIDTAYVEGWALYAEKLAYEQGFYSSNFYRLGHLQWELVRAARLVVDTGIHKKRWTREEAIAYMEKNTGLTKEAVISEIDRYFVLPGQACAYKIGQLKILELRQRAKDALGEKFDIKEFHNVILRIGATPLTILEEVVDQYIEGKLKA